MKLKVPIYKQKDELGCGPACLRMVLDCYRLKISEGKIVKKIGGIKRSYYKGTLATDLALLAQSLGFRTTLFAYNTYIMDPAEKKKARIIKRLKQVGAKDKEKYRSESIIKYLKSKGQYKIKRPDVRDLYRLVRRKIPLIIYLSTSALYEKQREGSGHSVVIIGFDKGGFYYNDPLDGGEHKISNDKLLFAWHNNVLDGTAYLLVVEKEK
jgi:ABC-type bacteriocin/lantibiotic exporter with double-glycine peptidase domain